MANNTGNYRIVVPDIGEGITEVEVVEWPVKVGDPIKEDDVVCVVMTDKASVEIPAPVDGEVISLGAEPGAMLAVGAELMMLAAEANHSNLDSTSKAAKQAEPLEAAAADKAPEMMQPDSTESQPEPVKQNAVSKPAPTHAQKQSAPRPEGEKPIAAPAVRERARQAGIDLRQVAGSGPAGRILHEDLDAFITNGSLATSNRTNQPLTGVDEIKVIGLRRKIAQVMQDTMQRIPHFTYVEEIDVTELEKLRSKLNLEKRDDQPKLTVLPFLMRAIVKAIAKYPQMSARYNDVDNVVERFAAAHIGIATQTDNGLMVPVVRHAESLDIWQSAAEVKRLSTAARQGNIGVDALNGSSITITSLGPMGGIVSTPVINSPEVAIVGVNKIVKRPVWQEGSFIPRDMMNLSSSFDHRIIDGWDATLFVQHLKSLLESPATLFMED